MSIIIFIIILGLLVLSHEFGHFIVAKWNGIRVDEFGFGFPPRIFSVTKGETTYSINLIPFGGFVKIFGEDGTPGEEVVDMSRSFPAQHRFIQGLVVAAGIICNILLAWVLFSIGFMMGMPTPPDVAFYGPVSSVHTVITEVLVDSPAAKAGLLPGEEIFGLQSGGVTLATPSTQQIREFMASHGGQPVTITYQKPGSSKTETVTVTPVADSELGKPVVGIALDSLGIVKLNPFQALIAGARLTKDTLVDTATGLAYFLSQLVGGQAGTALQGVTGPVGLVGVVGTATMFGFVYLLGLTATISLNLAVINLIPFPALDGGRLFFIIIEAIKRSPLNPKITNAWNSIGFVLLMLLMLAVTWHDIAKLI